MSTDLLKLLSTDYQKIKLIFLDRKSIYIDSVTFDTKNTKDSLSKINLVDLIDEIVAEHYDSNNIMLNQIFYKTGCITYRWKFYNHPNRRCSDNNCKKCMYYEDFS